MNNKIIRIFISCPDDVKNEKEKLIEICYSLNRSYCEKRGIELKCKVWDKDVPRIITGEKTQTIIEKYIGDYEIYFGILWKYFGTKGETGLTYTEKEFEDAYASLKSRGKPIIIFFFKNETLYPRNLEESNQLCSVIRFKDKMKSLNAGLIQEFETTDDFTSKAYDVILKVLDNINELFPREKLAEKNKYSLKGIYINRKVCYAKDFREYEFPFLENYIADDIINIIKKEKHVSLISDAGIGKTTELERIAAEYSESDEEINPFLVRLNTYVNQEIRSILPNSFKDTPIDQALVILDGLDEIQSKDRLNAIRNIEKFIQDNSEVHCVISSRTNFYSPESKEFSGTLKNFKTYVLLELDGEQIESYINNRLKNKVEEFNALIFRNNLQDLLKIPFYLVHFIELFKKSENLPDSKAKIYDELIKSRIENDIEKFRTTKLDIHESYCEILNTLKRIAVALELLGKNYLTYEELNQMIELKENKSVILYSSLFKKKMDDSYGFEHNNYREFLAAKVISTQQIDKVKEFFSFEPSFKKIIPSRINTLSFYMSILDRENLIFKEIIDWILENDSEVIVNVEKERIEEVKRVEIFTGIFNYYKVRKIYINRDKFNYRQLAKFGQSNQTVEFLLKEIEENEPLPTLNSAIEILGDLNLPNQYREKTKELLIGCIQNEENMVRYNALRTLSDLKFNSKDEIDQIISEIRDTDVDIVRAGIYYLLQNSDYNDEYIDVYLEGIKFLQHKFSLYSEQRESVSRIGDEYIFLSKGLEKTKSLISLSKLIKYFIKNPRDFFDLHLQKLDTLVSSLVNVYKEGNAIYKDVLELILTLHKEHFNGESKEFLKFFLKTGTQLNAFKDIFERRSDDYFLWDLLVSLINDKIIDEIIDYIIGQYKEGNVEERDIWYFQDNLRAFNEIFYLKFNSKINKETGNKFEVKGQPRRDHDKERDVALKRYIDLIFIKQNFIDEIRKIFKIVNKDRISNEDIRQIEEKNWANNKPIDFVLNEIRRITQNEKITLKSIIEYFDKIEWDLFILGEIYTYLSNKWNLHLTTVQIEWIDKWCKNNLNNVDFKRSLIPLDNKRYNNEWRAIYIWYYLRKYNFEYPKNILLDLLSFDWVESHQWIGIEYIEEKLNKSEIINRIFENLEEGIEVERVLLNHIDYCKKHKINEITKYIKPILLNSSYSWDIRKLSLDTYLELSFSLDDLVEIIDQITDEFKWTVIDSLTKSNKVDIHTKLKNMFEESESNDKLKVSIFLIKYQDIDALKFYVEVVKEKKMIPQIGWSLENTSLHHINTIDALPYLLDLLKISYQSDFNDSSVYSLKSIILDALSRIAILDSEENYEKVANAITKFIEENSQSLPHVNYIYTTLESIEQKYYSMKAETMSIESVKEKLDEIFT